MDISKIMDLTSSLSSVSGDVLQEYISKVLTIAVVPILALAIINCFFGYRIFRIVVTISGTMIGGAIGALVGLKLNSTTWLLAAILICALVGGFAAYKLYMAGAFVMGFFTGMLVGAVAMVVLQKDSILIAAVLAGLVLGLLAVDLYKYVLVALTSINGGMLIGVCANIILQKDSPKLILIVGVLCSVFGMIVQYIYAFTHDDEKTKDKKKRLVKQEKKRVKKAKPVNQDFDDEDDEEWIETDYRRKRPSIENIDIDDKRKNRQDNKERSYIQEEEYYVENEENITSYIPEIIFDNATNIMFVYVIISVLCDLIITQNKVGQTLVTYPVILFATAMINILKKDYKAAAAGFGVFEIVAILFFLGNMESGGIISAIIILAEMVCVGLIVVYIFKKYISMEEHIEPEYDFGHEEIEDEPEKILRKKENIVNEYESQRRKIDIINLEDEKEKTVRELQNEIRPERIKSINNTEMERDKEENLEATDELDISEMILKQTEEAMKYDDFSKM